MNRENLELMKTMLEEVRDGKFKIEGMRFDLNHWWCGTAACAMGFATEYQPFIDKGLHLCSGYPFFEKCSGLSAAEKLFDIDYRTAKYLFHPESYDLEDASNPQKVIDRITELLEQ